MAAESIEVRMARLEGSYEQVTERLGAIEARLDGMENRLDARMGGVELRIGRLEDKVDRQFYWLVGLIVISTLVPIGLRFLPLP